MVPKPTGSLAPAANPVIRGERSSVTLPQRPGPQFNWFVTYRFCQRGNQDRNAQYENSDNGRPTHPPPFPGGERTGRFRIPAPLLPSFTSFRRGRAEANGEGGGGVRGGAFSLNRRKSHPSRDTTPFRHRIPFVCAATKPRSSGEMDAGGNAGWKTGAPALRWNSRFAKS